MQWEALYNGHCNVQWELCRGNYAGGAVLRELSRRRCAEGAVQRALCRGSCVDEGSCAEGAV